MALEGLHHHIQRLQLASPEPSRLDFWLLSSSSSDFKHSCPHPRLLLDIPPPEIRAHIASYVSPTSQPSQLLALARTNPVQRIAVVTALRNRLVLPRNVDPQILARWVDVFRYDLKHLICMRGCMRQIPPLMDPQPTILFQSSTLRKAMLWDDTEVLRAISFSDSLREVELHFRGYEEALQALQALGTLKLHSLKLVCDVVGGENNLCPFEILATADKEHGIATHCPNLTSLHLCCTEHHSQYVIGRLLTRNVPGLRRLKELTLYCQPPDHTLSLLIGVRSVRIHDGSKLLYKSKFGCLASRLTKICTNDCFREKHSSKLASCVGLEDLETTLESGSLGSLAKALNGMESLRRLTLNWKKSYGDEQEDIRVEQTSLPEENNVVSLILENAPRIEALQFRNIHMPVGRILSILSGLREQLRELGVQLMGQDEDPLERLETVLRGVLANCPELRRFTVDVTGNGLFAEKMRIYRETRTWVPLEKQKIKVIQLLCLMNRRMPMLDVSDVEKLISRAK